MTYFQETMTCMHINSYKMYNLDDYSVIIFAPKTRNTELYSYEYLTVQYSRKKKKQYRTNFEKQCQFNNTPAGKGIKLQNQTKMLPQES